ncbi:sulfate permease [Cryobacterium sp. SO2]|uniref:sulfate permease n=1 Tax=Cryobacterium sp. SO2 TaxID=1897060 RepID=UPI00223D9026|nr:sulfate permease [Cryobacterium sp. SO2]WEO76066.1 sulfate permease [Cryobacterium sp. SO2]
MFGLILGLTARTHYSLRRFMPTNLVLDAIHTRRGLKWGMPSMLLAVPYALATVACVGLTESGGSGWLNMLALLFAWNSLKFLVAGPVTLIGLCRVRRREASARRFNTLLQGRNDVGLDRSDEPSFSSKSS